MTRRSNSPEQRRQFSFRLFQRWSAEAKALLKFSGGVLLLLAAILTVHSWTTLQALETVFLEEETAPWLLFAILVVVGVVTFWRYRQKLRTKSLSLVMKDILAGNIEGLYGLIAMLAFLILTSWVADDLHEHNYVYAFLSLLAILILGMLFIIWYPLESQLPEKVPPKVLVMALSAFSGNMEEFRRSLTQLHQRKLPGNWELPLRAVLSKPDLEHVFFLTSTKSWDQRQEFEKLLDEALLLNGHEGTSLNVQDLPGKPQLHFKGPVDFDSFRDIKQSLLKILEEIHSTHGRRYRDEEIIVNISGGTSAVTLALTLFALAKGRRIEYFEQGQVENDRPAALRDFDVTESDAVAFLRRLTLQE